MIIIMEISASERENNINRNKINELKWFHKISNFYDDFENVNGIYAWLNVS